MGAFGHPTHGDNMIDKKIVEAKLEELNKNKLIVEERIRVAQDTIRQSNADLNAIFGAQQLAEQLLEDKKPEEEKTSEAAEAVKNV
tara:strand:+ start:392 stop:649 length:258 start_codon:yes stop_codon:yes gene_type:complete